MMKRPSKLQTTIDFEKSGKQTGYLRLPHSVHRSAYGWIPIPIACIKNGSGPTVLLISGTHGDEYEGQVALSKLINQLKPEEIQGRIIIVPMANFPAAKAGLRTSPIDEQNLNRIYPGDPDGSPSFMIAHYI
ncbi:MAG: succinylglutamate desuccinylase/aspartoacylase family protein, partial [SAR324 cluster bacterium]|nr:succinylglutamate desuccinylase/aspartoacylase family protein [SAR324 cluster bacterium]